MDSFNDFNFENELDFETAYQMLSNMDSIINENEQDHGHTILNTASNQINTPVLSHERIFNDTSPPNNIICHIETKDNIKSSNDDIGNNNKHILTSINNESNLLSSKIQSIRSPPNGYDNLQTNFVDKSNLSSFKIQHNANTLINISSNVSSPMGLKSLLLDANINKTSDDNFNILLNNNGNGNIDNNINNKLKHNINQTINSIFDESSNKLQSNDKNSQKMIYNNITSEPTPTNDYNLDKYMFTAPQNTQQNVPIDDIKQSNDHDLLSSIESHAIEHFLDALLSKDEGNNSISSTFPTINLTQSPETNINHHKLNNNSDNNINLNVKNHIGKDINLDISPKNIHDKTGNKFTTNNNSSIKLISSQKTIPNISHDISMSSRDHQKDLNSQNIQISNIDKTSLNYQKNTNKNNQLNTIIFNKPITLQDKSIVLDTHDNDSDQYENHSNHDNYDKEYIPAPIDLPDIKSHKIEPPKSIINDYNAIKKWRHVEIEKMRRNYTKDKYDELSNLKRLKNGNKSKDSANMGKRVSKHIVLNNIVDDIRNLLNANRKLEDLINDGL